MKKLPILILFLAVFAFGCSGIENKNREAGAAPEGISLEGNESIYWVNSLRSDCVGTGPMQCLQIQRGSELKPDGWEVFYSPIRGFEYEPGYVYKLIVKEESVPSDQVPADGASMTYTLIKTLAKQIDDKLRLNDVWALTAIRGEALNVDEGQKRPRLEIDLRDMRISGDDGCNNFTGGIGSLDSKKIVFSAIAATRKACVDMDLPDRFHQNLNKVRTYSIKDLELYLFDEQGDELLVFKKTD